MSHSGASSQDLTTPSRDSHGVSNTLGFRLESTQNKTSALSPGSPRLLEHSRTVIDDLEEQVYYKDEQRVHRPAHNRTPLNDTRRPPSVMSMGTIVSNSRAWTPRAEPALTNSDKAVPPTQPVNSRLEAQQSPGEAQRTESLSKHNGQTYIAVDNATESDFGAHAKSEEATGNAAHGQIFTCQDLAGRSTVTSTCAPRPPTHSAVLKSPVPVETPSEAHAIQPNVTSESTRFLASQTTAIPQLQQSAVSMAQQAAAFIPPFPPPYWPSMQMATPGSQMAMPPYPYGMYPYSGLPQMAPMPTAPQTPQSSQDAYAAWQSSMAMHSYAMTYGVSVQSRFRSSINLTRCPSLCQGWVCKPLWPTACSPDVHCRHERRRPSSRTLRLCIFPQGTQVDTLRQSLHLVQKLPIPVIMKLPNEQ
jgi:hypothetical protein